MSSSVLNRSPSNDISVLISGAGVGGLTAALECWRKGCRVRVLERSKSNIATGDSFFIGPTAMNGFRNWPEMQKRNEELRYHPLVAYCNHKGEQWAGPFEFTEVVAKGSTEEEARAREFYRQSRPKFHGLLHEQLEKIGVQVEFGCGVVDYFEDTERAQAGVVLKDGTRIEADLVVAADGLRGKSWELIAGRPVPAASSGLGIFRVAYPVEMATSDPMVAERFKLLENGRSVIEMWVGPNMNASFWRSEDEMSWTVTHPDDGKSAEEWSHHATIEEVLKFTATIPGWPEVADRAIKTAPAERLIDWKLMWRDPQPKWISQAGRVVQLGDAAHSFLPSSGNGGTQAMEDAISLATCLSLAGNKRKVSDATRVHNVLRFERVSCLQAFGIVNSEKNNQVFDAQKEDPKQRQAHIGKWIVEHDPELYAVNNYEDAREHVQNGKPFKNTNTPPGMVYRPWTIDGLLEAHRKGEPTVLDGDWS